MEFILKEIKKGNNIEISYNDEISREEFDELLKNGFEEGSRYIEISFKYDRRPHMTILEIDEEVGDDDELDIENSLGDDNQVFQISTKTSSLDEYKLKIISSSKTELDDISGIIKKFPTYKKEFIKKKEYVLNKNNFKLILSIQKKHDGKTYEEPSQEFYHLSIIPLNTSKFTKKQVDELIQTILDMISKPTSKSSSKSSSKSQSTSAPKMEWELPNRIGYGEKIFKNFRPENYQMEKKMECECKEGVCDVADKSINLFPQQRLIKDFIQFDSPYRGALLYHDLGSGKSGASIASAEGYINKKKMFVLSPASLAVNYENEILKISSIGLNLKKDWSLVKVSKTNAKAVQLLIKKYAIDKSIIKKDGLVWIPLYEDDIPNASIIRSQPTVDDKPAINEMISHIIRNRYTFISYNGLTANLINGLGESPFDNSFVIIDEVHNFASRIVNGSKLAREIYIRLMNAKDCRIILLSGTPIINNPYEISAIVNLIRGYMNIYELELMKGSKMLSQEEFINQLKKSGLFDIIDEYGIDQENYKILLSFLPVGYKRNQSNFVVKSQWKFDETSAISQIITSLNQIKNVKVGEKYQMNSYSALPNTREEFNAMFMDLSDDDNPKIRNEDLFMRRVLGTISYYSISGSDLFPKRLDDITRYLDMTDIQFKKYTDVRAIERNMDNAKKGKRGGLFDDKGSVYRAFSRMVCNFSFPEGIERLYPNDIRKALKKEIDEDTNSLGSVDSEMADVKEAPKAFDIYEEKLRKAVRQLLDGGYLTYENTKKNFSPKFSAMLDDINGSKGSCLVYSQFRSVEGLGLFTEFLNMNGFKQIDLKRVDGEFYLTDEEVFDEVYANKRYVVFDQDREKTKYLMNLFNGDFKNLPKEVIRVLPEDLNQLYGKIVKVFCITASGAEGISLKNVRAVLITEPYWNNIRIDQVIGRAIRSCSHETLPLEDRNVVVYRYIMRFTKNQLKDYTIQTLDKGLTTDEHILMMANKKMAMVNQFLDMLKAGSFDCVINASHNRPLKNGFRCYSWALGVNKDDLAYTANIKEDYKIMKHKKLQIARRNKGRVVSKKGVKYVEMNGKIYNYHSYVNAEILIPEEI